MKLINFKTKTRDTATKFKPVDHLKMLDENSPFAVREAYNAIRTRLLFTSAGKKCPAYVLTSAMPMTGKTINTVNLGIAMANLGRRTLIIDADMRNPTVHNCFLLRRKDGLSEVLAGLTDEANIHSTSIDKLSVLTAGEIPPNPAELLSSERMDELLKYAEGKFDCILIDSPPVNIVSDAAVIGAKVTGCVLIVRANSTKTPELQYAVNFLEQIGTKVTGFMLNDVNDKKSSYYSRSYSGYKYRHAYSYGSKPLGENPQKGRVRNDN